MSFVVDKMWKIDWDSLDMWSMCLLKKVWEKTEAWEVGDNNFERDKSQVER